MGIARSRFFAESGIGVSQGYIESDVRERMAQSVANRCHTPRCHVAVPALIERADLALFSLSQWLDANNVSLDASPGDDSARRTWIRPVVE
jgi:hypothetical protein